MPLQTEPTPSSESRADRRTATPPPGVHRAVVQHRYGSPEVLGLEDRPTPEPGPGEVLLKVEAAAVARGDWHLARGKPYLIRAVGFGLRRPAQPTPGQYAAGSVVAVGSDVAGLSVGDRVFGSVPACLAEYATAAADALAPIPEALSFEGAAALPHGGFAALQALRDAGRLRAGQRVLVTGAAGAVGSLAVQIAAAHGAEVTALVRSYQVDYARELGADAILTSDRDDFAAAPERFDLIVDNVRDRPDRDYRRALAPGGRCVMVSGGAGAWLGGMHRVPGALLGSLFSSKKLVPFLAVPRRADLLALNALVRAGQLHQRIAHRLPLDRSADAFRTLDQSGLLGAVVVTPAAPPT